MQHLGRRDLDKEFRVAIILSLVCLLSQPLNAQVIIKDTVVILSGQGLRRGGDPLTPTTNTVYAPFCANVTYYVPENQINSLCVDTLKFIVGNSSSVLLVCGCNWCYTSGYILNTVGPVAEGTPVTIAAGRRYYPAQNCNTQPCHDPLPVELDQDPGNLNRYDVSIDGLPAGTITFTNNLSVTQPTVQITHPGQPQQTGGIDSATVTVTVTRGGQPLENIPVDLDARAVDSSGGHAHTAGRPAGFFGDSDGMTDSNGVYSTKFFSHWFGGEEWIVASSSQLQYRDSVKMTIKVPGLQSLPAGINYVKIGGTCTHYGPSDNPEVPSSCRVPDNNHSAAQIVRDSLPLMANVWVDSLEQDTLFINDISLPFGGIFDIDGTWAPPHTTHGQGLEVDIRTELLSVNPPRRGIKVRNAQGQTVKNKEFEKIAKRFGVRLPNIDEEGTNFEHYHLYYRSP